ncbi:MAG: LCP family protein [Actinomycetes bacterium]
MRTTLKRGVGRGAELHGQNGDAVFPPGPISAIARYRQPPDDGRSGLGLLGRILLGTLLTIVSAGLGVAGGAYLWFHESVGSVRAHSSDVVVASRQLDATIPRAAAVALVVGYDQRAGAEYSTVSRSDTVMLIRADPSTKTISLLSFPRDLVVPIYCPKQTYSLGTNRINAAYADCGSGGTLDTVKHLTGLPVNYLITVNFHGFKEIVDRLGGIWMDVDQRYYNRNSGSAASDYASINLQPGYQRLGGQQALDLVRFRHTDDDYHRLARQQAFVRSLKQQVARNFDPLRLPGIVSAITTNVEVGGSFNDSTVLSYALFAATLPGGRFFQEKIENISGVGETHASTDSIAQAVNQFSHPDVQSSKAANAAALGTKPKVKKTKAPAPADTTVTVLNGNGIAGSAANGSYLLAQRGYVSVVPPNGASADAPSQTYFHTKLYFDSSIAGAKEAAKELGTLLIPADVAPLPNDPALRVLDPGVMVLVVLGETFHDQLSVSMPATPALSHQTPSVYESSTTGVDLLKPYVSRVPFKLQAPTVFASNGEPDREKASRMYWMDGQGHHKAVRLVFRMPNGAGEYWGIEETNMTDPPVLGDKSFQHSLNGREFSFYYSGQHLHMIVLRVHDTSYWVVNTLLDGLSNETMIAIAKGLKPIAAVK